MVSNSLEGNEMLEEPSAVFAVPGDNESSGPTEGLTIIWQIILMKREVMAGVALKKRQLMRKNNVSERMEELKQSSE